MEYFHGRETGTLQFVEGKSSTGEIAEPATEAGEGSGYEVSKRILDIVFCLAALPVFLGLCIVFMILNPFWNRGPLFYMQRRTGKDRRDFVMIKFRTMLPKQGRVRGPNDPLEKSRITHLGRWMRQSRMDEVPQILNVLFGDMSLIGPRPEMTEFSNVYLSEIPGYSLRWKVRPGITGYAQIKFGYTDTIEMVRTKTDLDLYYIRNMGWRLDLFVLLKTVSVVCSGSGAR